MTTTPNHPPALRLLSLAEKTVKITSPRCCISWASTDAPRPGDMPSVGVKAAERHMPIVYSTPGVSHFSVTSQVMAQAEQWESQPVPKA